MHVDDDFAARLDARFNGRFRLRWSNVEGRFLLEQKVNRALAEGSICLSAKNVQERRTTHEDKVRASEGYLLTAVVLAGTRAYCNFCDRPTSVRPFTFWSLKCDYCANQGRESKIVGGYFPHNDILLEAIEKVDPHKGGQDRVANEAKRDNAFLEQQNMNDLTNPIEAAFFERHARIVGIAQTGHTGKIFAGSEGPGTR